MLWECGRALLSAERVCLTVGRGRRKEKGRAMVDGGGRIGWKWGLAWVVGFSLAATALPNFAQRPVQQRFAAALAGLSRAQRSQAATDQSWYLSRPGSPGVTICHPHNAAGSGQLLGVVVLGDGVVQPLQR